MRYIKENQTGSSIKNLCTWLFQLCVIADAIIGFDPRLYIVSKGCMLAFFIVMLFNIIWNLDLKIGSAFVLPVLFMLVTVASCMWADYPNATILKLTTQVQLYVLFFFTYALFTNETIDVRKYFDALYIAGIGMTLFALYRYGLTGIIKGMNEGKRIGRMITNENVFGMVFSKAAIVAFFYYLRSKKAQIRLIHIFLIIIFTFFAFSSGSKKAFLMILAGIFGINILENGIKKSWKTIMVSVLIILCIFLILQLPVFSTMNERIMGFFTGEKDKSELQRTKMIDLSLQLFYEKPILGHGFNNFGTITGLGAYSHNNMTEVLVSTGLIGFILFYFPYVNILKWGWKNGVMKKDYVVILFLILSVIYLIFGYGMVEYYDKEYWMFLGVMVACVDNEKIMRKEEGINASLQTIPC